jgi:5-methylcytosine-specific restriction endonuclease McrBC GTP-binding regulatory subunit McrB
MAVELKKGIAVGEYLKEKIDGGSITYSFVPQVFAKAYAAAWKQYFCAGNKSTTENQVYLVIEEINRGNCAQIFGDIFQLLDRDGEGFSQYSIDADCDFAEWLKEDSILKTVWVDYETKVGDGKLKLPPNLNILATMNTSDQSLFPMDSAFKRRFDWEYVPINYEKAEADFIVGDTGFNFKWLDFLKKVNADIYKVTQSEDKQMGEFFIKPKNKDYVTLDEFRSKVLFYLWDSVYKDELDSKLVFHFAYPEKGPDVTFQRLFNSDFVEILKQMLANLDDNYKDGAQQE